jgi:hypothetical protein
VVAPTPGVVGMTFVTAVAKTLTARRSWTRTEREIFDLILENCKI